MKGLIMKYIRLIPFMVLMGLFNSPVFAATVNGVSCADAGANCTVDAGINLTGLTEVYNVMPDGFGVIEVGSLDYADTYLTQFTSLNSANLTVDSSYSGSDFCSSCYLLIDSGLDDTTNDVKFLFDLSSGALAWDGMAQLSIDSFFSDIGGTIASISLYEDLSVSPVPVPAAIWLFGSALLGFIGFSRKTRVG